MRHRLFEFLGATKELATTPVPGPYSFTSALIYALEILVKEKGSFTTVELLNKIKSHAPDFPKDQTPVLSDRKDDVQAGRIMLHPIHKLQQDGSKTELPSEESANLDPFKRQTVTLHFEFTEKPSHANVQMLGRHLNQGFERYTLGVNAVRWGGMKRSAAARAVGNFQAGLKRYRRESMKRQQPAMDMGGTELWSVDTNPELLTPSSSTQHSPPALEIAATVSIDIRSPDVSAILFSNSLSSDDESDESQIPARKVRNKKQKSDIDGREAG